MYGDGSFGEAPFAAEAEAQVTDAFTVNRHRKWARWIEPVFEYFW